MVHTIVSGAGGVQIIGQADHQDHIVHHMLHTVPWAIFLLIMII